MRSWIAVFKSYFETFPRTAVWLVSTLLDVENDWFEDFLLRCTDALARATFVQIVSIAVAAFSPKGNLGV
jgi:hypothetical protein